MSAFLAFRFRKGSHVKLTWLATYKYSQIKMRRDGKRPQRDYHRKETPPLANIEIYSRIAEVSM
jgi:hypothetical protein